jgi:hypothetical protein
MQKDGRINIFFETTSLAASTIALHGTEAFTGKASKGEVVVVYFESLAALHMEASVRPKGEV